MSRPRSVWPAGSPSSGRRCGPSSLAAARPRSARRADRHRRRHAALRRARLRAARRRRGEPDRLPHDHAGAAQRPALRGPVPVRARQPDERDPAARTRDAPRFEDWKGIGAKILVATRAAGRERRAQVEVRVYFVDSGQPMLQRRYSGKTDNPRIFAHQASDDIMTLTPVQGRRAHADRVRVGPRRHQGAALEGALHRRLRRLQPAPRDGERLAQHPAGVAARRRGARLRLLPPGLARSSTSRRSSRARASRT